MREQAFIDAYEASRWDAFAAALDDFVVLFEGLLRRAARGSEVALADSLVRAAGTVLTRYDPPERPDRWADELRNLRDRLARMQLAAPADAETIAKVGGTRIYEGLPLHSDMTRHDRELVTNAVRFNFSNIATDLPRSVDADALVAALLRGADADTAGPAAPGVG